MSEYPLGVIPDFTLVSTVTRISGSLGGLEAKLLEKRLLLPGFCKF